MDEKLSEQNRLNLLKSYFDTYGLVRHQLETFDYFIFHELKTIIDDEACIIFNGKSSVPNQNFQSPIEKRHKSTGDYGSKGGKIMLKFENIFVAKPVIINDDRTVRPLYPAEARQKMLTYDSVIFVDVLEYVFEGDSEILINKHLRIPIARFPIMVGSSTCNLYNCTPEEKIKLGETIKDPGGYFIINGNERVLIGQLRNAYNRSICYRNKSFEPLLCEIRSMSEETGHSVLVQLKLNNPNVKKRVFEKSGIDVIISQSKIPIPIGYVFKVLEVNTIAKLKLLIGSEDFFQKYLILMLKEENIQDEQITQFIQQDMFPHLGVSATSKEKAILLGKMVRKLLLINENELGTENVPRFTVEDRDNYSNKRVEMAGVLCYELFRMLYKRFIKSSIMQLEKRNRVEMDVISKNSFITTGIHFSFSTGNWGVQKNNYIRTGVAQIPQNKVSFSAFFSYLRRFVIPMGKEGKNTKIRQVHPSSIFFACPAETPEGQFVGITLNLSMLANVSMRTSTVLLKCIICFSHQYFKETSANMQNGFVTIFINGGVAGFTTRPEQLIKDVYELKKLKCIRYDVSIVYTKELSEIHISGDAGRFIRPLLNLNEIKKNKPSWNSFENCFENNHVVYKDAYEIEQSLIAIDINEANKFDFMEIHPSCMLGVMAAQIPFAEHTQSPRLCYQASMAKQAIGNIPGHHIKSDNTMRVMDYLQRPFVSTNIAEMNGFNEYPNGVNAMVAVAIYSGFNQEDSVILNKASVDRGMFNVTTYKTIIVEERKTGCNEKICIPPSSIRKMYDYSLLEDNERSLYYGIVKLKSVVKKNMVLVGKTVSKVVKDGSKNEFDKSVLVSSSEEGKVERIIRIIKKGILMYKIIIAQQKRPEIGDKFCSDMAQKGTVGMILEEVDMPFMKNGTVPDIIINPHCLPSRMTINQIMASILGKICCEKNEIFGDASPFKEKTFNSKDKIAELCNELKTLGYNYNGTETMMCGWTGEVLRAEIFFGPVYYHRLIHMVSDKIFPEQAPIKNDTQFHGNL